MKLNYKNLVPEHSFIGCYMDMMSEQETAQSFDFWCAVWCIGAFFGRHVVVARPKAPVYLNWYIILSGESGIVRKSTSVNIAKRVATHSLALHNDYALMDTKTSPEFIEETLSNLSLKYGHAKMLISISELATFLGREKYVRGLPSLLTDLYDCPTVRYGGGTLGRGKREIHNCFVSFMSASTPSWLLSAINPDVIEGGFTSRVLFVGGDKPKKRIAWPSDDSKYSPEFVAKLLPHLKPNQHITVNELALTTFSNWYKRRKIPLDPFGGSFASREDSHVLRLAACLAINRGARFICAEDIVKAIKCVEAVKEYASSMFVGGQYSNDVVKAIDAVRIALIDVGAAGISQSDLNRKLRTKADAKIVSSILEVLHTLGMVNKYSGVKTAGRSKTMWRAKDLIASKNATSLVINQLNV